MPRIILMPSGESSANGVSLMALTELIHSHRAIVLQCNFF